MATTRTVRQLLERSLRLIGALAIGETPEAAQTQTALQVLQDLIAERAGSLFVPIVVQEAITLVSAQASYTVGENGTPDLNTQRPEQIKDAWVRDSSNNDYPVRIIGEVDYNAIRDKTISERPEKLWYNPTAPNGTIYTWPVAVVAESLYISSIKTLTEPTSLTQNLLNAVSIPRSYHNPLGFILAVELAPEYGRRPSDIVIAKAEIGENRIKALNLARTISPAVIEPGTDPESRGTGDSILNF